ncbi:MAG: hypothetical protein ABI042_18740 [Verrucomicrobiota bacterium]
MKTNLTLLFILLTNHLAFAEWSTNSTNNNLICGDFYHQNGIQMISDGSGGAIITWLDYRSPGNYSIFAQRINKYGTNQWTTNGVQISPFGISGEYPSITSDGNGGAIITWSGGGNFASVIAQRVSAGGVIQWGTNGTLVSTMNVPYESGKITSDGSGGAIIAWTDGRTLDSFDYNIYAQRINSNGIVQWVSNGVAIVVAPKYQGSLQIAGDGNGEAVIAWQDTRDDRGTNVDVFVQKVSATGSMQWNPNGVALSSTLGGGDRYLQLFSEAGAAIVCWQDTRNGIDLNIYAQKINSNGAVQWAANGVAASLSTNNQEFSQLTTDANGGAIICWVDLPLGLGIRDIYAQRINSSGTVLWASNGAPVCTQSNNQALPQIARDGYGGATIVWVDGRGPTNPNDIYSQRIDANGIALWTTNGVAVSTATGNQTLPFIINDGINGMIVSFQDGRKDPNRSDIYAQRLNPDGTLGRVIPLALSAAVRPTASRFQFTISGTIGRTNIIEVSSTLTNWTPIATNVVLSEFYNYTNLNATNLLRQFYRIRQTP